MSSFLDDLPQNVKAWAEKRNLTNPRTIITTPIEDLLEGNCTENDVRVLKAAAAKILAPRILSASELLTSSHLKKWSRLTFGCASIDRSMRGGLVTRGITEICGESGVGKTQLLIQLSLTVQLPVELGGLGKSAAYICTEDVFPSKRLYQIAESFLERYPQHKINYLGNIYIEHVLEGDELLKCVSQRLAKLMEKVNIGLIIVDSVAAVYRVYSNYIERAREMRRFANHLLHFADKYNCAIVCVNQVTTVSDTKSAVPCLGLAWAHLGRTRIKVSKIPKQYKIKGKLLTARKFEVLYSPESPSDTAEFLITEQGVVEVSSACLVK